jgi:hypothetical protein
MSNPSFEWDISNGEAELTEWDALRDAIQAQVVAASGLSPDHVIWDDQGGDRPDDDFVTLRFEVSDVAAPATPEITVSDNIVAVDGAATTNVGAVFTLVDVTNLPLIASPAPVLTDNIGIIDPSRYVVNLNAGSFDFTGHTAPTGPLLVMYSAQPLHKEIAITVIDHTDLMLDVQFYSTKHTGKGAAYARLTAVREYLQREDVQDQLDASDVALVEIGTIKNLSTVLETQFESRALFSVTCRAAMGAEQLTTYIETANADWAPGQPRGSALNP